MQIRTIQHDAVTVAIASDTPSLCSADDVLDLAISARYETGADRLVLEKSAFCDDFFVLRTGLAGEALQKLINYHFKLAIIGDFSQVASKALRDFIPRIEPRQKRVLCRPATTMPSPGSAARKLRARTAL